jgi:hypothetical protein
MTILSRAIRRVTKGSLGGHHGADRGRRLVVTLRDGDLVELRPHGTRRRKFVSVFDVYDFIIRAEARAAALEKARAKRERRQR